MQINNFSRIKYFLNKKVKFSEKDAYVYQQLKRYIIATNKNKNYFIGKIKFIDKTLKFGLLNKAKNLLYDLKELIEMNHSDEIYNVVIFNHIRKLNR